VLLHSVVAWIASGQNGDTISTDLLVNGNIQAVDKTNPSNTINIMQGINPPGTLLAYAGGNIPAGYLWCDGREESRTQFPILFSTIGTNFGAGDGVTTFNLPDMRGRTAIGNGIATGITGRNIGDFGGEETHTLAVTEMPSHAHEITWYPDTTFTPGNLDVVIGASGTVGWNSQQGYGAATSAGNDGLSHYTGNGSPHNIMQPYTVVGYIIKY